MACGDYPRGLTSDSSITKADGGVELDEYFKALADSRRRYVLHYLREEERASLTATAQQVAVWEHQYSSDTVSKNTVEELKIDIYHTHLPRLQRATILEYDHDSRMLIYLNPPDIVRACLDLSSPRDLPS